MSIRFGTAGTSESFKAMGYKDSLDVPEYTAKFGLNAFECWPCALWTSALPPALILAT